MALTKCPVTDHRHSLRQFHALQHLTVQKCLFANFAHVTSRQHRWNLHRAFRSLIFLNSHAAIFQKGAHKLLRRKARECTNYTPFSSLFYPSQASRTHRPSSFKYLRNLDLSFLIAISPFPILPKRQHSFTEIKWRLCARIAVNPIFFGIQPRLIAICNNHLPVCIIICPCFSVPKYICLLRIIKIMTIIISRTHCMKPIFKLNRYQYLVLLR